MGCEQSHAVITPTLIAGPGRNGHNFDMRHAQFGKMTEVWDSPVKGAFATKGPDVQLVQYRADLGRTPPELVMPFELTMIVEFREPVHPIRLPQAPRVRVRSGIVVKQERIPVTTAGFRNFAGPPAPLVWAVHR